MNRFALIAAGLGIASSVAGCAATRSGGPSGGAAAEQPTFVYFIHPARAGFIESPTADEQAAVGKHFAYLKSLTEQGVVLLAGPGTDPPYTGIVIFRAADRTRAVAVMNADPAVRAGVFHARLSPLRLSLVGAIPSNVAPAS